MGAIVFASAALATPRPAAASVDAPITLQPAEQAWLVELPDVPARGSALDADRVYVPLQHQLIALDRTDGRMVWTHDVAASTAPLVIDGIVVVSTTGALLGLDPGTGGIRWRLEIPQTHAIVTAASAGWLLMGTAAGELRAVRAADGQTVWSQPLAAGRLTALAADPDRVYATTVDAQLIALSRGDGRERWRHTLSGTLSPPAAAGDRVVVGTSDNALFAFHADSGRLAWRWRMGGTVIGVAADADSIYAVSLDNLLRALNRRNGNQRWAQGLPARPLSPPAVAGGLVIVPGGAQAIMAFAARDGMPAGAYTAPGTLENGPPGLLRGMPLVDSAIKPFGVAAVVVLRDGRAIGLRPVAMLFPEPLLPPLITLPGRPMLPDSW